MRTWNSTAVPVWLTLGLLAGTAAFLSRGADPAGPARDRLLHHRNLGKALFENPATQAQAVEELKRAADAAPDSAKDRLNYGLALQRAGKTKEAIEALSQAQKQDPAIPHTWFNLGIIYKREGEYDNSIRQLEEMARLAPDEPVPHYNLGVLYKLKGEVPKAVSKFELASRLNPNLAGPHFQLYNAYRQGGRAEDAARELKTFQEIKKRTAGAAIPEDMEWCNYAELFETIDVADSKEEFAPLTAVKFERKKLADGFGGNAGLAVMDADGDGKSDVVAWTEAGVRFFPTGAATARPIPGMSGIVSLSPADFDNDGFTDLCVLTKDGAELWKQTQGRWEKLRVALPPGAYRKAVWIDYDHDYDLDLILLGDKPVLLRNQGDNGFADVTASFPFAAGAAIDGVAIDSVADTNGVDLAVAYADHSGILYRDKLAGRFEAVPLAALPANARSLTAVDADNDSWTDLAVQTPSGAALLLNKRGSFSAAALGASSGAGLLLVDLENRGVADVFAGGRLLRNLGAGQFREQTPATLPVIQAIAAVDLGGALPSVAMITDGGALELARPEAASKNKWIRVGLKGIKNQKLALGAEVEVKAGLAYRKQIYQGTPLVFGLRAYTQADAVRITWPNGLIQNEANQAALKSYSYEEAQRLSGSCPMIFTWNGTRFEFITDILGVAPLGAASGDGTFFPTDHDEYIQIPGEALAARDGFYDIRITEELREVTYLDQLRLMAVDHLAATAIVTNDKFKSPPYPEFRLYGVERPVPPVAARDHHGADVLSKLARRDQSYAAGFERTPDGVAELHSLDLDFGSAARENRAVLVLSGWVDWADGSTFLGAAQRKNGGLVMPYLQVRDQAGNWKTVIEDMGIPAGKPKTIAVDLTGKFLSASREVRIVTNLCVYWDQIYLSEQNGAPQAKLTPLNAAQALLRHRGFSRPTIHPQRRQPESFDYNSWMPVSMWNPIPGYYTRFGDVRELLGTIDDRFVVMGSGDELSLRFDASALPALPAGWKRDFLLHADGWAKDGDANTAHSGSVEPLPFHAMSAYPYPDSESYPSGPGHFAYQNEYNTRPAARLLQPLARSRK